MSQLDGFFQSIEVEAFRSFDKMKLDGLGEINVISGPNGTGKSAVLECLFLAIDLNSPTCLIRPFIWRGIPLSGDDFEPLLRRGSDKATIKVTTTAGELDLTFRYGTPTEATLLSASRDVSVEGRNVLSQLSAPNLKGMNLNARWTVDASQAGDKPVEGHWYFTQRAETINATASMGARLPEVSGTYITMHQPTGFAETAERVSKIIKEDKKDILLEYLRLIEPGVEDIAVFQDNANSQTYVKNESGFVPVSLMGGGFRALHDIATAAMLSKNGVVFLDEMDASLHYTVVASVWKAIAEISKSEKVQIFSVTHSKETLNSIVEGVEQAGAQDGFRYVRMNKNGKEHKTTVYKFSDLKDAIELNVEVRK